MQKHMGRTMQRRAAILLSAAAAFAVSGVPVCANVIGFNPDGTATANGQYQVGSFDFKQGNNLLKGIGDIATAKTGQAVTNYMQANLGSLLDQSGNIITGVTGLNSTFEITVVLGFSATANVSGPVLEYSLASSPTVKFFEFYYDDFTTGTQANDLTGTGFNDGTRILWGELLEANSVFLRFGSDARFDQFGADDYANKQTKVGAGGGSYKIKVMDADPNFFSPVDPDFDLVFHNSSAVTPFREVNPSQLFWDGSNTIGPNLGGTNGTGVDFQYQADTNSSFVVPEPSSLFALVIGAGVLSLSRRRRAKIARSANA